MQTYELKTLRLDQLNIPAETLRQSSTPAADKQLKESIEANGILAPFVVTKLGKDEYAVWDGTRRTRNLRELGFAGNTPVPALIAQGGDSESVIHQININQARERLSEMAEAEALRQLVKDHNWSQIDASRKLLKSKAWASKIMKVWSLPKEILKELRNGNLHLSHCMVMAKYVEKPKIMEMLFKEALNSVISREQLTALGKAVESDGIATAKKRKPKKYKFTSESWARTEPLQKGDRIEVHIQAGDDKAKIKAELIKIIDAL